VSDTIWSKPITGSPPIFLTMSLSPKPLRIMELVSTLYRLKSDIFQKDPHTNNSTCGLGIKLLFIIEFGINSTTRIN